MRNRVTWLPAYSESCAWAWTVEQALDWYEKAIEYPAPTPSRCIFRQSPNWAVFGPILATRPCAAKCFCLIEPQLLQVLGVKSLDRHLNKERITG